MGSKSKRLGSGFEYEIRDILREATGEMTFERSPSSGAFVGGSNAFRTKTLRNDATEIMSGDLIVPANWRWMVECKNHVDIPVHQLFLGDGCKEVDSFLEQTSYTASLINKQPLLFMKLRKSPATFSKKLKDIIIESGGALPQTKTVSLGILVAEMSDHSHDIAHLNHITYTGLLEDGTPITWRFFDIEKWIKYVKERQNQ